MLRFGIRSFARKSKAPRARSGYILFGIDHRAGIVAANPNARASEIMSLIGSEWKSASPSVVAKYNAMSQAEKDTIDAAKPNVVKKPKSAYIYFTIQNRPYVLSEYPGISAIETMKKMGELWRATDQNTKEYYQDMANEDKLRYAAEVAQME